MKTTNSQLDKSKYTATYMLLKLIGIIQGFTSRGTSGVFILRSENRVVEDSFCLHLFSEMGAGKAIGIDLGTTYCCVAVWQHDRIEIIANNQGNRTTPSMVAFTPSQRLVGDEARYQVSTNPHNTVFDAKRLIGRRFSDPCVQSDMKHWPFTVVAGNNGQPVIQVDYKGETKCFAPEEISSMILVKMKMIAEDFLACDVKNSVITVPAYFNNSQRTATKNAAKVAGLSVRRILNEPTAAAIAYGFHTDVCKSNKEKTILVFDLGGGTFDVSILNVHGDNFEVKAVGGDAHLGGEDFDNRLLDHCVEQFNRKTKKQLNTNAKALRRLRSECERAKRTLSSVVDTVIAIDSLHGGLDFNIKIRRAKFEELNADLFEKCMQVVKQCLEDAKLSKEQIEEVVLVGGSTRIPKVQELLEELLQGKKLCKNINPDEAVAYGAAVHAAALNNEEIRIVLHDVTPLSLGIGTRVDEAVMSVVVPRNTPLPTRKENIYVTGKDNTTSEKIPVYEGERALTADNNFLGMFVLNGIPAGPCGRRVKVVFEVDVDGILRVSAQDEGSGVNSDITIDYDSDKLPTEEIQRMLCDAEKFRRDDEEAKKKHVVKSNMENYIYNMRNRMKEGEKKMDTKVAADINQTLNVAAEWLDEDENPDIDQLQRQLEALKLKCRALI